MKGQGVVQSCQTFGSTSTAGVFLQRLRIKGLNGLVIGVWKPDLHPAPWRTVVGPKVRPSSQS